jgi:hypothetical protein
MGRYDRQTVITEHLVQIEAPSGPPVGMLGTTSGANEGLVSDRNENRVFVDFWLTKYV